jgi:predicted nucleotidyltransferase
MVTWAEDTHEVLALVIIGSVARGDARVDSDVDCYVVVTDAEYERRLADGTTALTAKDLGDEWSLDAAGPVVDLAFLRDVATRGPEPMRYAFVDAKLPFARDHEVAALLKDIPVYQEHERTDKMIGFLSQIPVHRSYLELGEYSGNPYLLAQPAVEMVLAGGRLLLANSRQLYPGRKHFLRELSCVPERPPGIVELACELLARPSISLAHHWSQLIMSFAEWPQPREGHWERYRRDRELGWRYGVVSLLDS